MILDIKKISTLYVTNFSSAGLKYMNSMLLKFICSPTYATSDDNPKRITFNCSCVLVARAR